MSGILRYCLFLIIAASTVGCLSEDVNLELDIPLYKGSIEGGLVYTFPEEINDVYISESKIEDPSAIGFAIAESGNLYKRVKDNQNWNWEVVGKTASGKPSSIYALDQSRILVSMHGSHEFIMQSKDGGESWLEVYRVAEEDVNLNFTPVEFLFIDEQIGFCYSAHNGVGTNYEEHRNHFILYTNDGGDSWSKMHLQSSLENNSNSSIKIGIWNMVMIDEVLFAMGTHLFYSQDKGISWTHVPIVGYIYGIGRNTEGNYFLGGQAKILTSEFYTGPWDYMTYDQGVFPPDIPSLQHSQFPNIERFYVWENFAIASGLNATWTSYDGCKSWKRPEGDFLNQRTHKICYSEVEGAWYDLHTPGNTDRNTHLNRFELNPN